MIKFTIIIPVYNEEKFLNQCLDSVLNQTYKNLEIICIDDCSTDNSYEILKEYQNKDSRIVLMQNPQNNGPGETKNFGPNNATIFLFKTFIKSFLKNHLPNMFKSIMKRFLLKTKSV